MLFDPVLSYTYENGISRYTYLDLPKSIDYVLITHNHQDHVLFETLLQIRHKVKNFIVPRNGGGQLQDPSLKLLLEQCGFRNVIEATEMQDIQTGNVTITALPFLGEHADLDIRTKLAWMVKIGPHAMVFAADSCNIEPRLYEHIHREVGDVDALFLGMECDGAPLSWLYGPLLTGRIERAMDESRRLSGSNFEQGRSIVELFKCKDVYVYAMGQEPWLNYIMSIKYTSESRPIVESDKLLKWCCERGIVAERLFGEKEILIEQPRRMAMSGAIPEFSPMITAR
jgi:L-ascorbate metabolism protein UlaG (beta-lactamase superfamily)